MKTIHYLFLLMCTLLTVFSANVSFSQTGPMSSVCHDDFTKNPEPEKSHKLSYNNARKWILQNAEKYEITSAASYYEAWIENDLGSLGLPSLPENYYKDQEWEGWEKFLDLI